MESPEIAAKNSFPLTWISGLSKKGTSRTMPGAKVGENMVTKVVVVGGSYGGVAFVTDFEKRVNDLNVEITLIERRDKLHHCVGAFRSIVEDGFVEKIWVPYDKLFTSPRHRVLHHNVKEVHVDHLITDDGVEISFDYLVIATGSSSPKPCKTEALKSEDGIAEAEKILGILKESSSVLVIGGGACGVELSGEIKSKYPQKNVTLVHSRQRILDYTNYSDSFKSIALDYLQGTLGVNVILGDAAEVQGLNWTNSIRVGETTTTTKGGKVIESDLQFYTVGMKIDISFISTLKPSASSQDFSLETIVNPTDNSLNVLPTLQLANPSFPHIFAVGDVCNADPTRTAYGASKQAQLASKNMSIMLRGSNETLGEYSPSTMMLVTMGAKGGAAQTPIGAFGSWFTWWAKSRDLMVEKRWKLMGLPSPF